MERVKCHEYDFHSEILKYAEEQKDVRKQQIKETQPSETHKNEKFQPGHQIDLHLAQKYANLPNQIFKTKVLQIFELNQRLDTDFEEEMKRAKLLNLV